MSQTNRRVAKNMFMPLEGRKVRVELDVSSGDPGPGRTP